jgi:molybdopterin-guanine dinucleotide biosynthesis protein A
MLAAVILAGGLSKRFGTNKLLYKIDGEAIINRVFKAV